MGVFDSIKDKYPESVIRLNKQKIISLKKLVERYGMGSETLQDSKGNKTQAFGISPDKDGNYSITDIMDTLSDNYLPVDLSGKAAYTSQTTTGAKFKLLSFVNQLVSQSKEFTKSKGISEIVTHEIDYDKILSELIDQGIVKFIMAKQDKTYLLIGYFDRGPLLSQQDIENLIQVVVEGDQSVFMKEFNPWIVYKLNHDARYYKNNTDSQDRELMLYKPQLARELKRTYDKIIYLVGVTRTFSLPTYNFTY